MVFCQDSTFQKLPFISEGSIKAAIEETKMFKKNPTSKLLNTFLKRKYLQISFELEWRTRVKQFILP